MIRTPVPWPVEHPLCYGLSHNPQDRTCRACPQQAFCAVRTAQWADVPSLAEHAARCEEAVTRLPGLTDDPVALFAALYRKHYGASHPGMQRWQSRAKVQASVARAVAFCTAEGLDVAVYLSAQMHAFTHIRRLGRSPQVRRLRIFPVSWIHGTPKSVERYRTFLRVATRVYRRRIESALDERTAAGSVRWALAEAEEAVAEEFLTQWRLTGTADWQVACDTVSPDRTWRALEHQTGATDPAVRQAWVGLLGQFGRDGCRLLKQFAQLHAAVSLADQLQYGLASRLGFRPPWSWPAFAHTVTRLCGGVRTDPLRAPLPGVHGVWWGAQRRSLYAGR